MPFLKKTIVWTIFLVAMYLGGVCTQSSSNFFQGMGFFSIVAACVSLYIIFKLVWGPLETLQRFFLIGGVLIYAAFSIGLFNGNTLKSFLSGTPHSQNTGFNEKEDQTAEIDALEIEMFGDLSANKIGTTNNAENTQAKPEKAVSDNRSNQLLIEVYNGTKTANNTPVDSANGVLDKVKSWFGGGNHNPSSGTKTLNPLDYPEMQGHPQVVSASILVLDGVRIKLFGIDAPDPTQTCENKYGNSYHCGKEAIIWMRDRLNKRNVSCRILSRVENNRTTGICFLRRGNIDLAEAVVSAGWAVAYTEHTQHYVTYERQAAQARRGLWSGRFYRPWDWRQLQNRKVEINVETKSKWFNFKEWFK